MNSKSYEFQAPVGTVANREIHGQFRALFKQTYGSELPEDSHFIKQKVAIGNKSEMNFMIYYILKDFGIIYNNN